MKRVLLGILAGFLLLIIVTLSLAPGLAKSYVVKHSPELVGRAISIDKLRINYLNWKVRLTGFNLYEADDQAVFVSFDTLLTDLKPLKLIRNQLEVQQFYLSGLEVYLILEDSTFNFSDLLAFHSDNKSDTLTSADPKDPLRYYLYDFELNKANVILENRNLEDTIGLRDISFTIPFVGWDQEEKSEAGLRFSLAKEGFLEAGININPVNGEFDASLTLFHLYLESLQKYASSYADIGSISGLLNTRMDLIGNVNEPGQSIVSGNFELMDLYLADQNHREIVGAEAIRMAIGEIDAYNSRFLIDSLILSKPYLYFEMKDSSNNLMDILNINPADTTAVIDSGQDSLSRNEEIGIYYALGSFRLDDGALDLRDHTTGDAFDYKLSDIQINADSIESSTERIGIYASMLLNERGKLLSETSFSPLNPGNFVLNYTISDFRLSDLNLYSRYYVGFPIIYGDMYYRGHTEVMNHQLVSDNKLIMDRVELGEKSKGLHDLPLKLALYILKDRHDVIELDIPVRGRTDDPQLKVGYIVWNTIKNRIFGVVEAPYDYLAGMVGADPAELEAIEFAYGDTMLTPDRQRQLDLLLELEQLKSELEIDLIYYNDYEKETESIAREIHDSDSLLNQPGVIDSLAVAYTVTRINNIQLYLHTASDSSRIEILRSEAPDPLNKGSRPIFKVEYSMKSTSKGLKGEAVMKH